MEMGDLSRRKISPIQWSSTYFSSMVTANKAGKEALSHLLDKLGA
jgi:hypothetical protein